MEYTGLSDWKSKLVAFGTDGASVNIGAGGLKGLMENEVPWTTFFWCLAHRLELALKDSLKTTYLDEMLLRLYYLYEKSSKKCAQLDEAVQELRLCMEEDVRPTCKDNRPLRACGTRFVWHKVSALGRVIDKYRTYLNHLTTISEDHTVKAAGREKLKGVLLAMVRL